MWFLRKMAWPISLLYGLVVYIRNQLYDRGILQSRSFDMPIICIGNLSVGGTGKTPMIEFLISRLRESYKLAVLSRGYKRKSTGFQIAGKNVTVAQLGDEPFQIYSKFPEVIVAVDSDRRNGIARLKEEVRPDIILLDDAFQHRKVKPSFSILLTTYDRPYIKDTYLPTGSLRDSKYAAKRADILVVTKCPDTISEKEMTVFKNRLNAKENQKVLFASLVYDGMLFGEKAGMGIEDLKGSLFTLVTGIANPKPLVEFFEKENLVFEHLKFADHHNFSASEIARLQTEEFIVTTEKDYVRLKGKIKNLYCIKVAHQFLGDGELELLDAINTGIKPYH